MAKGSSPNKYQTKGNFGYTKISNLTATDWFERRIWMFATCIMQSHPFQKDNRFTNK